MVNHFIKAVQASLLTSLFTFTALHGGYPDDCDVSQRICFDDLSDTKVPWASCWSVATDLSSMLHVALQTSPNRSLRELSPENVKIELLEYQTVAIEKAPKSALFPAEAYRCLNSLHIKVKLKVVGCYGELIHEEIISSDHVLDSDGLQHDYCRYNNRSQSYPCTPLAHAHEEFTIDLLARIDRLQQRGML